MLDHDVAQLALRELLVNHLTVATTGSMSLEATATGYLRADPGGSFLTDGFAAGMEVTPSGFTQAAVGVIESVTATAMTIVGGRTVEASGAGRSLTVALPTGRAWENSRYEPMAPSPWVEENYLPGPVEQITLGALATLECQPTYVVKVYGQAEVGSLALARYANKILRLYAPGTEFVLTGGDVLYVRRDVAPYRGQLMQAVPGFAVVVITVPLRARTLNII